MDNFLTQPWDFSGGKKVLYWTGLFGFVATMQFYLWIIAVCLYFFFDCEKNKTENYQIEKSYLKFAVITGNIMLLLALYIFARVFNG